jgi:hypothetical protein
MAGEAITEKAFERSKLEDDKASAHSATPQEVDDDNAVQARAIVGVGDSELVSWNDDNDLRNPHNWSLRRKLITTMLISLCTFTVSFGSSVISGATEVLAEQYQVGTTVVVLTISLYVLGFAAGKHASQRVVHISFP